MRVVLTSDTHRGYSEKTHTIHEDFAARLASEDADVYIFAGDLGLNRKEHFRKSLEFFRKALGSKPILLVRGNHDFQDCSFSFHTYRWRVYQKSFRAMLKQQSEWFSEFDFHHLEDGPFLYGHHLFVGWDGWYGTAEADLEKRHQELVHIFHKKIGMPSDPQRLTPFTEGIRTYEWLRKRSDEMFLNALKTAEGFSGGREKVIAVTHMPPYATAPEYELHDGDVTQLARLAPYAATLMHGHSHQFSDRILDDVRILNAGSDYDKPRYIAVDF